MSGSGKGVGERGRERGREKGSGNMGSGDLPRLDLED